MDLTILNLLNSTLAHPLLDQVMIAVTTIGLALLPALGIVLIVRGPRRVGVTILASLVIGLATALVFQLLGMRPRPDEVRLLLPSPIFPSYPSGHTTAAFSVAAAIGLSFREKRWWGIALFGAMLMALSRVYLGHHYPSDILGGAVLGLAIGAACYGVLASSDLDLKWLLWPQLGIALIVSHMAYLRLLPLYLLRWPMADKVLHFLLIGAVTFWLNFWWADRRWTLGRWAVPMAIALPLSVALLEEGLQLFSPWRTADVADLGSDLLGMLFFWWLSCTLIKRKEAGTRPIDSTGLPSN